MGYSEPNLLVQNQQMKHLKKCKIFSKLTIKTPERRHWHGYVVLIVKIEEISHLILVFLLLTLNK